MIIMVDKSSSAIQDVHTENRHLESRARAWGEFCASKMASDFVQAVKPLSFYCPFAQQ